MEIKSNQSEPVTTAVQSKGDWADGVGKDTIERGSSKCFILIFSLVALFAFYVVLPGLLRELVLAGACAASCGGHAGLQLES